jgi:hypothetical protein
VTECLTFAKQGGPVGIESDCLASRGGSVGIDSATLAGRDGIVGIENANLTGQDVAAGIENGSLIQRTDGGKAAGIRPGGRNEAGRMAGGTGATTHGRRHFDVIRVKKSPGAATPVLVSSNCSDDGSDFPHNLSTEKSCLKLTTSIINLSSCLCCNYILF